MRLILTANLVLALLVGACSVTPVTSDERGPFDTVLGVYGGNEFSATSSEGARRTRADEARATPAPAARSAAPAVALAPAAPAAPASVTPAPALAAPPLPAIAIDANAYAAVFGSAAAGVAPSPAQLLQLDSLSLVTAEALRIDLQKKILACRRAGEACRLTPQ